MGDAVSSLLLGRKRWLFTGRGAIVRYFCPYLTFYVAGLSRRVYRPVGARHNRIVHRRLYLAGDALFLVTPTIVRRLGGWHLTTCRRLVDDEQRERGTNEE